MKTTSQARSDIWKSIKEHGPSLVAGASGLSLSMLYKFKGGSRFGPESVSALKPILEDVDDATWLAAMGVEAGAETTEAVA